MMVGISFFLRVCNNSNRKKRDEEYNFELPAKVKAKKKAKTNTVCPIFSNAAHSLLKYTLEFMMQNQQRGKQYQMQHAAPWMHLLQQCCG